MTEKQAQAAAAALTLPAGFTATTRQDPDSLTYITHVDGPGGWICEFALPSEAAWAQQQINAAR